MKPKRLYSLLAAVILSGLLLNSTAHAQFTSDYQTNLISGETVDWTGTYAVGTNAVYDFLGITDGGVLVSDAGGIGVDVGGLGNDSVSVSGIGSVWSNINDLAIGNSDYNYGGFGASESDALTITDGGAVYDGNCTVGGLNNVILVSGNGSVWNNSGDVILLGYGEAEGDSSITIVDGGVVSDDTFSTGGGGNKLLVVGHGSVWSNHNDLFLESDGGDSLVISNGGAVYDLDGSVGGLSSVLVSGDGSVWGNSNSLIEEGDFASVIISNGGVVYSAGGELRASPGSKLVVTDVGSVWRVGGNLDVHGDQTLIVADEGIVIAGNVDNESFIIISGGSLYVTNGVGTGVLTAQFDDSFTLNSGTVTLDSLNGDITFNGGTLNTKGTVVSDEAMFTVGDGTNAATLHLDSGGTGIHSFTNGLIISTNAFLTGSGTIEGFVIIDYGGTVRAHRGGTLNFTGSVTNNGIIHVHKGATLNFYGPVVNNGIIEARKGRVHFWSTVQNNGKILPRGHIVIITNDLHRKRK